MQRVNAGWPSADRDTPQVQGLQVQIVLAMKELVARAKLVVLSVAAILNGSTIRLLVEDEDEFAMLAKGLFIELDVQARAKFEMLLFRWKLKWNIFLSQVHFIFQFQDYSAIQRKLLSKFFLNTPLPLNLIGYRYQSFHIHFATANTAATKRYRNFSIPLFTLLRLRKKSQTKHR